MSSSPSITETVILYLREGVKLDDDADASAAAHAFRQGLETIKAQPGFIRQFWVFPPANHASCFMLHLSNDGLGLAS